MVMLLVCMSTMTMPTFVCVGYHLQFYRLCIIQFCYHGNVVCAAGLW